MSSPRLTMALPVFNGERFLCAAVDSLLAQTFTDFELIICDNGSTDDTPRIAESYARADARVRYLRLPDNRGSAFSHSIGVREARGEYFKWTSDDDLYAPTLLQRCVDILDANPDVVLAHSWTAFIDENGEILDVPAYGIETDARDAPTRFRSLLYAPGGDDIYGVVRASAFRKFMPYPSHYHADRTFVSELALEGRFEQVPEPLYFRREHPGRSERQGLRGRSIRLDPRRQSWRHPAVRLVAEYLFRYLTAIRRAPISERNKRRCYCDLMIWMLRHGNPFRSMAWYASQIATGSAESASVEAFTSPFSGVKSQ